MDDRRRESAKKLSPMNLQPKLCNGEKSGFECSHYWRIVQAVDAENPHHLRRGDVTRFCTLVQIGNGPLDLGNSGSEQAVFCNRYEQSLRPYCKEDEEYNPMTLKEIDALDKQIDASVEEYGEAAFNAATFVAGLGVNNTSEDNEDDQ